jgi:PAS domain S-box-containing protein
MKKAKTEFSILIIEDNAGDFALVEEFLLEQIETVTLVQAKSCKEARELLIGGDGIFDVVLLDLSLPDKTGIPLIREIVDLCSGMPVIVLTGYTDLTFGVNSLALGISDYILKEELNSMFLYKSILYSIERKKSVAALSESEKQYSELFHMSPQPMYVIDPGTLHFLDVNDAAVKFYGYSHHEFLQMTIKDVSPAYETQRIGEIFASAYLDNCAAYTGSFCQRKRNGKLRKVDIQSSVIDYKGKKAVLALSIDITERLNYIKAIELQNKKLREISWIQSHVVRAPLARIMGLVTLFKDVDSCQEKEEMLAFLIQSANELDKAIKDITDMTRVRADDKGMRAGYALCARSVN